MLVVSMAQETLMSLGPFLVLVVIAVGSDGDFSIRRQWWHGTWAHCCHHWRKRTVVVIIPCSSRVNLVSKKGREKSTQKNLPYGPRDVNDISWAFFSFFPPPCRLPVHVSKKPGGDVVRWCKGSSSSLLEVVVAVCRLFMFHMHRLL